MKNEFILSQQGYLIPCINQINQMNKTVIICHGFGSSKNSPTVSALQNELPKHGIGTFSFDFPNHGESLVDGYDLRLRNCLNDIKTVEDYILNIAPDTEILYFGSSFGAYTLLVYLATYPHVGRTAFLRSCACEMHNILQGFLKATPFPIIHSAVDSSLDKIIMDEAYNKSFFITNEFINDLNGYNIFDLYPIKFHNIHMIHGELDSVAPLKDAKRFSDLTNTALAVLPNAEHRLMDNDELDKVLNETVNFFREK